MLLGVTGNQAGGLAHVGGCVRPYQVSRLLPINRSSLLSLLPLCCGASIHASSTEPAGSPSHASIAAHEPGSSSGSTALPWAYFDKRVYANFQDDGYTTWRGYALS